MGVSYRVLFLATFVVGSVVVVDAQQLPAQGPPSNAVSDRLSGEESRARAREILARSLSTVDQVRDVKIRAAAHWKWFYALSNAGLHDQAFRQVIELRSINPHTCILSLKAIATRAHESGDSARVDQCLRMAIDVSRENKFTYSDDVIDIAFKVDRPLRQIESIAAEITGNYRDRVYGGIRDWLARKGRVEDAYRIARTYLSHQKEIHHHRQIGYSCASVKHYDYEAKHDYFGQTIRVIQSMPPGKDRDFVISQLVANLVYKTGQDSVTQQEWSLAKSWADKVDDEQTRARARESVLRRKMPDSIESTKKRLESVQLREEKLTLWRHLSQQLIQHGRLDEADATLSERLQLITEQPRQPRVSAFGRSDDQHARYAEIWIHERAMIDALLKADAVQKAKRRAEKLECIARPTETMMLGDLRGIRQQLLLKLGSSMNFERCFESSIQNNRIDSLW